ncbi:hypothetical protein Pmar_PMAR009833, partial [Perkinsus marinus ATCC 50983]
QTPVGFTISSINPAATPDNNTFHVKHMQRYKCYRRPVRGGRALNVPRSNPSGVIFKYSHHT